MVKVLYFPSVTSTNDVAAEEAKGGAAHLTTITADEQTKGRGRLGRIWQTFPEGGLAMSVIVRGSGALLPILVSVALHKALSKVGAVQIKWPNDILANGKKLSGILIESYPDPTVKGQRFYIVGIGVNVNTPPQGLPADLEATTLQAISGLPHQKREILAEIVNELDKTLDLQAQEGDDPIINYYRHHCGTIGQNVRWVDSGKEILGKAQGINDDGNLLLLTDDGAHVTCTTGDVIYKF